MIYTYDELNEKKKNGIELDFDQISKEQLEKLFIDENISNNRIAELYNVNYEKVRGKRRKWDISIFSPKYTYKRYVENNNGLFDKLNIDSKERIMSSMNIDSIAKALTHHVFRNGPVENMHANGQLSQNDMKVLNKYMVNKIAGLLKLIEDGEWLKIEIMLGYLQYYGGDWDEAEYDISDIEFIFKRQFGMKDELEQSAKIGV